MRGQTEQNLEGSLGIPIRSGVPDNAERQRMEKAFAHDTKKIQCVLARKELFQREGAMAQRDAEDASSSLRLCVFAPLR